jgi:hypothetical protein
LLDNSVPPDGRPNALRFYRDFSAYAPDSLIVNGSLRTEAGNRQLTAAEAAFAQAIATSLQQLPKRNAPVFKRPPATSPAVVEVVLVDLGWSLLYHDERPSSGGHG